MGPLLSSVLICLALATQVLAYGGGLDGQGGHHNRKEVGYHFHLGPLKGRSFSSKVDATATLRVHNRPVKKTTRVPKKALLAPKVQVPPVQPERNEWKNAEIFRVSRVIDGDTVELEFGRKVRLIGLDTPETVHSKKPVERCGREASQFLKNLLSGESVYVVYDQDRTDRYGRMLLTYIACLMASS